MAKKKKGKESDLAWPGGGRKQEDAGEARAEALSRALGGFAGDIRVALLPRIKEGEKAAKTRHEALVAAAAGIMRLVGEDNAHVADAALAAEGVAEEVRKEVVTDAMFEVMRRPPWREHRRAEVGNDLIRYVESLTEVDERGVPVVPTIAEVVCSRWPKMGFYENPATLRMATGGVWLEIRRGRWHHLLASEVEHRVRQVYRARQDGGRVDSEHINKAARETMVDLHSILRRGTTDQIDASDHILDKTGLPIDLQTGEPCDPDMSKPLMARLNVAYVKGAESKVYVPAIRQCLMAGRSEEDGEEVVAWRRRMDGYLFDKEKREQIYVLNVGGGNNGKTTMEEAVLHYLGQAYGHVMDPDPMMVGFKGDPLTGFNSMIGKLMTLVEELPEGAELNPGTIKRISGGRMMEVRKRYEDNKVVRMTSQVRINSNVRPLIRDHTKGGSRRRVFVEWRADFTADVVRKDLAKELEDDGPGWLNHALAGLREYRKIGEARPACIREDTKAYEVAAGDPLKTFYDRFLRRVEGGPPLLIKDIRLAYMNWLENTGEVNDEEHAKRAAGSPMVFRRKLQNMVGTGVSQDGSRMWVLAGHEMAADDGLGRLTGAAKEAGALGLKVVGGTAVPPEGPAGMVEDGDWGE